MSLMLLLGLHHLAETIQPDWLIENKKKHIFAHYEHACVWTFLISIGLWIFGEISISKIVFLLIGHMSIDIFFYLIRPNLRKKNYNYVLLDQLFHYLQIIIVL